MLSGYSVGEERVAYETIQEAMHAQLYRRREDGT